jgi:hypothetical protein
MLLHMRQASRSSRLPFSSVSPSAIPAIPYSKHDSAVSYANIASVSVHPRGRRGGPAQSTRNNHAANRDRTKQ